MCEAFLPPSVCESLGSRRVLNELSLGAGGGGVPCCRRELRQVSDPHASQRERTRPFEHPHPGSTVASTQGTMISACSLSILPLKSNPTRGSDIRQLTPHLFERGPSGPHGLRLNCYTHRVCLKEDERARGEGAPGAAAGVGIWRFMNYLFKQMYTRHFRWSSSPGPLEGACGRASWRRSPLGHV